MEPQNERPDCLPILAYGQPVLRKKSREITDIDGAVMDLVRRMSATLIQANGLGLAAPQVGRSLSLCVVNLPAFDGRHTRPLALINPRIMQTEGKIVHQEGCLSFPGIYEDITRPRRVAVAGIDEQGREIEMEATEMLARVFLHEVDHLNGVLFIDHLSTLKRQLLKGELRKLSGKK
jgi:peptide deformylase